MSEKIRVQGARTDNLENTNVDVLLNPIAAIAGVLGSEKSSLSPTILT